MAIDWLSVLWENDMKFRPLSFFGHQVNFPFVIQHNPFAQRQANARAFEVDFVEDVVLLRSPEDRALRYVIESG